MIHRNSQKRIYGDYNYFITCDVANRRDFFKEDLFCDLWIEEMKLCKELKKFKLFAFCLNYEHFHWIIKPNNEVANYSKIMQFLKRHFTRNSNIVLGYNIQDIKTIEHDNMNDNEGEIGQYRLRCREKGKSWQIKMDEFVLKTRKKFIQKYGTNHDIAKFTWQRSFHDHIIRNRKDFINHWSYTMYNYAKHNLPDDWQYTGLNYAEIIDDN